MFSKQNRNKWYFQTLTSVEIENLFTKVEKISLSTQWTFNAPVRSLTIMINLLNMLVYLNENSIGAKFYLLDKQ